MSEPSLLDDLKEVKANWDDPEFRRGFWTGFRPYLITFPLYVLGGLVFGFLISRAVA